MLINMKKIFLGLVGSVLFVMMQVGYLFAADTYYVHPSGSASWDQCMNNRETPCSAKTSMSNANAGDTVIFLDGVYDVGERVDWEHPALMPTNSGSSGASIIFKAENSLYAIIHGTGTISGASVLGVQGHDWIVYDGFKITAEDKDGGDSVPGQACFFNAENCTIQNCEIDGGGNPVLGSPNVNAVTARHVVGMHVKNCIIHGFKNTDNQHNTGGYQSYDSTGAIIENCTIYDCTSAIFDKEGGNSNVYRKNLIYNCSYGFEIQSASGKDNSNHEIYQNIFSNLSFSVFIKPPNDSNEADNIKIFNNTSYNNTRGICYADGDNWQFWNNIFVGSSKAAIYGTGLKGHPTYSDYNCIYNGEYFGVHVYETTEKKFSSLSSWKSSYSLHDGSNPDMNSIAENPIFEDPEILDFRLKETSPCRGKGINRENNKIELDIGAYPNGDDGTVIGYTPPGSPSRPDKRFLWLSSH